MKKITMSPEEEQQAKRFLDLVSKKKKTERIGPSKEFVEERISEYKQMLGVDE